MTTVTIPQQHDDVDPDDTNTWRLVRKGERAPIQGDHGSWVETDHPAVVACMGSTAQCATHGCQFRRLLPYLRHLQDCEIGSWVVEARPPEAEPDPGHDGACTCGLAEILDPPQEPTA